MDVRAALVDWYERSRRDLPWRRSRDPYAIWVSEIMLQQTRVEVVCAYYERWMVALPTVAALAAAPLDQVLGLWAGLGYYSRARNLHRAAQQVVAEHGGRLPDTVEALRALPGIGRYTAGAIASIAFGQPAPALDGNALRVLARLFLAEDGKAAWQVASELVRGGPAPGSFNQALMELGATVCTPRQPACLVCPAVAFCQARARGIQEQVPPPRPARTVPLVEEAVVVLRRQGRLLLVRRPPRGLWGGLWEFPTGQSPRDAVHRVGLRMRTAREVGLVEHTLTHRHMRFHIFGAEAAAGRVRLAGYEAHRWAAPPEVAHAPISTATRRILSAWAAARR
ncbi:MAG TPA: A/G-specific adenine glycosylase [Polyangia bacterium]|nr:A/G-specific adenine glycosylase [Polyangia bacterium]